MHGWLVALVLALVGCASAPPPSVPAPLPTPSPSARPPETLASPADRWRAGLKFDGRTWHITYAFPAPQRALIFDSTHGSYRTAQWSSPAPWVSLEHVNGLDALFFVEPTKAVQFDIQPPTTAPEGTLAVVPFSDGSHAFWAGQLAVLTAENRAAVERLGGDLRAWQGTQPEIHVELSSDVPVLGPDGAVRQFVGTVQHGRGPFFYTGQTADPMLIVDSGLPEWVKSAFRLRMPEVQKALEKLWAQQLPTPQLMLAWGGSEGKWSNRGRAEGRQIVMRIEGARYLKTDPELLGELVWFFAHEMTHLHQFADAGDGESWMIEGFADTTATDVLVRMGLWDKKVLERRYWSVARECSRELSRGPLARRRGRVAYVCGDLIGVALMGSIPGGNLGRLWKEARAHGEPRVTTEQLLRAARNLGATEKAVSAIVAFVTLDHQDTDEAIGSLLESAGLKPSYVNGSLSSMSFPFGR